MVIVTISKYHIMIKIRNYEDVIRQKEKPVFDSTHIQRFSPATSPSNCTASEFRKCGKIRIKSNKKVNVCWTLDNICKAAQLLKKPPENLLVRHFANYLTGRIKTTVYYDEYRSKLSEYKKIVRKAKRDSWTFL
ncbi:hypothetical protein FF38_01027 [Lucilia cuprina]|uniref:Uncharacterized protein n=1 Tax=Lucilia cuprina TaxID=7375 RepID=A0A0L0CHC3_LUCCU|nr:hypothetical protein FF38_01027 [Lucilia cuprina]